MRAMQLVVSSAVVVTVLGTGCGSATHRPERPTAAGTWNECEAVRESICGTFAWDAAAQRFDARWDNGAEGHVTVRVTGDAIEMERVDTGGPYPGTRGTYRGARTATGFQGDVTWTLPNGDVLQGRWEAAGDPPPAPQVASTAPEATSTQPNETAVVANEAPAPAATPAPRPTQNAPAPTAPAPSPAPAPAQPASSTCPVDAFLAFVGPDKHLECSGEMITIERVDRASCTVSATVYMGPAMGNEPLQLTLGPRPAGTRAPAGDAEVRVVTRQGDAFRMDGGRCTRLSAADYEESYNEREQINTMVDDE